MREKVREIEVVGGGRRESTADEAKNGKRRNLGVRRREGDEGRYNAGFQRCHYGG